jgi:hypothetical protein
MNPNADAGSSAWPLWQRVLFRFFFVYWLLQIAPWTWLSRIPGARLLPNYVSQLTDWAVRASNSRFFHVRETLIAVNGSGDTSWAWARLWLFFGLAVTGCVIWSVLDRRSRSYPRLGYWLRTFVRYYIATFALSYGIIKLFRLQMVFPSVSQLATPLGDLLPMRLSWLFIGYSDMYQFFSGLMETLAGVLLLYRRTVTLGLLTATGAFANVVMINMSYDVPVKIFASHLLLACLFLLAWDARRLITLFVLNRPVPGTRAYEPYFTLPGQRRAAALLKLTMVVLILVLPLRDSLNRFKASRLPPAAGPFRPGIYDVRAWVVNGDTIPASANDSLRWRDVVFDSHNSGSVNTPDSLFWQRYRRGYFRYRVNPEEQTAVVWKTSFALDSTYLFTWRYELPDSNTIRLRTAIRGDSLLVELARSRRHFQLTERQFHWLSEYNR